MANYTLVNTTQDRIACNGIVVPGNGSVDVDQVNDEVLWAVNNGYINITRNGYNTDYQNSLVTGALTDNTGGTTDGTLATAEADNNAAELNAKLNELRNQIADMEYRMLKAGI